MKTAAVQLYHKKESVFDIVQCMYILVGSDKCVSSTVYVVIDGSELGVSCPVCVIGGSYNIPVSFVPCMSKCVGQIWVMSFTV